MASGQVGGGAESETLAEKQLLEGRRGNTTF